MHEQLQERAHALPPPAPGRLAGGGAASTGDAAAAVLGGNLQLQHRVTPKCKSPTRRASDDVTAKRKPT